MNVGEIVFGGSLWLAVPLSLLAGLVSFASPCVLPLVPGYLGIVGGQADGRRRVARSVLGAALFVLGFSVVFVAFGIAFGAAGFALKPWIDLVTRIMGALIIVLGLVFVGFFRLFQRTAKINLAPRVGLAGAPLLGVVFGLGWTPCIGPTLAAIFSLSLDAATPARGALLGVAYCIGLGLPFVLLAAGFHWASSSLTFLRRHIRAINIAGGVLLILIGVLMVTGLWNLIIVNTQVMIGEYVTAL
nr:MAG: cytochrome C biogenesis protein [actinobacterium acMicro-1]